MVFSSTVFLCLFLPVVLGLYLIIPGRFRNLFLFLASLVFYAWGEPVYVLLMVFSTCINYGAGLLLERNDEKDACRKLLLILSLIVDLGLLCFFKYTNFLIENVNTLTGAGLKLLKLTMPIGISFYTFQALSYVIDVYRRTVPVQHSLIDFGMYISLFPQLIAGPIVRYADVEKQLANRPTDLSSITCGIFRFTLGLAKKVLLANSRGQLFDAVYATGGRVSALSAWLGALAFMLQIYFDFSGYSDMAIGLGYMFGFEFPENFRYPYEAASITDFWRRWHITLGTWFREYVYIPLGGNRKGLPRQILNLLIVWFLTGLWHGAGWNFILWGLYFFVVLVIEKVFLLKLYQKLPAWVPHLVTLLLLLFSWVIFACDDVTVLTAYIASFFGANGLLDELGLFLGSGYGILLLVGAVCATRLPKLVWQKLWGGERLSAGRTSKPFADVFAESAAKTSTDTAAGASADASPEFSAETAAESSTDAMAESSADASPESSADSSSNVAGLALRAILCFALLALCLAVIVSESYNPFLYFRF